MAISSRPVNPEAGYSIEPHGPAGRYALYFGRDDASHGLNLCALSDFDRNGEETRRKIVEGLNFVVNSFFARVPVGSDALADLVSLGWKMVDRTDLSVDLVSGGAAFARAATERPIPKSPAEGPSHSGQLPQVKDGLKLFIERGGFYRCDACGEIEPYGGNAETNGTHGGCPRTDLGAGKRPARWVPYDVRIARDVADGNDLGKIEVVTTTWKTYTGTWTVTGIGAESSQYGAHVWLSPEFVDQVNGIPLGAVVRLVDPNESRILPGVERARDFLNQRCAGLQRDVEHARAEATELRATADHQTAEIADLQKRIAQHEAANAKLREELGEQQAENERLQDELRGLRIAKPTGDVLRELDDLKTRNSTQARTILELQESRSDYDLRSVARSVADQFDSIARQLDAVTKPVTSSSQVIVRQHPSDRAWHTIWASGRFRETVWSLPHDDLEAIGDAIDRYSSVLYGPKAVPVDRWWREKPT